MDLSKLQPHLPADIYKQLPSVLPFGIDGPLRLSNFMGQCHVESVGFTVFTENLNYSAQGLATTWPHRYSVDPQVNPKVPNPLAISLAHHPVAIANNVYANKNGNGDEASSDGSLYIGRGAIQLTGKINYKAFGDSVNIDLITHPELVSTTYKLASAAYFFKSHQLWSICDLGIDINTITRITKVINGGDSALDQRIQYTQQYYNWLTS